MQVLLRPITPEPCGVAAVGSRLYLACGSGGLIIEDVSDPARPVRLGNFPASSMATMTDVAVSGGLAYVTESPGYGVRVIDVSDPANPREVGRLASPIDAESAYLEGSTLWTSTWRGTVRTVNVANPVAPVLLDSLGVAGAPGDIIVAGSRAFLAAHARGLLVVDGLDPRNLSVLSTLDGGAAVHALAVSNDYVFSAAGDDGLVVLDVADPARPVLVGSAAGDGFQCIARSGTLAAVGTSERGVLLFDLSDPSAPAALGTVPLGWVSDIAAAGAHFVAVSPNVGLFVIDATDPRAPRIASSLSYGYPREVEVQGGTAYLVAGGRLRAIDISDPSAPAEAASVPAVNDESYLAVDGNLLYVADGSLLRIFDVSSPLAPVAKGTLSLSWLTGGVAAAGSRAFVSFSPWSWHPSAFAVIDVSDPALPLLEDTVQAGVGPVWLEVSGAKLYASNRGPEIFDISSCPLPPPGAPALTAPPDGGSDPTCTVELEWTAVPEAMTYDVYVDSVNPPRTLAASGLAETRWRAELPVAGTRYWQVVARNGQGEARSPVWSFLSEATAPTTAVLNSFRLAKGAGGEIELRWDNVSPPADDYVVLRDLRPDGPFDTIVASGTDGGTGVRLPRPGSCVVFYRVAARLGTDCIGPH